MNRRQPDWPLGVNFTQAPGDALKVCPLLEALSGGCCVSGEEVAGAELERLFQLARGHIVGELQGVYDEVLRKGKPFR